MDFNAGRPKPEDPLLLYSLAEFGEIIFEAFEICGVRTVVEIGAGDGSLTERLADWAAAKGGAAVCIDPRPSRKLLDLAARSPSVEVAAEPSLTALARLGPRDAYLLDSDHNYFAVAGELSAIAAACEESGAEPLVLLRDVGWPTGRRDMYHDPESLPAGATHPYDFGGVVPWEERTVGGRGFRGQGQFAYATHEGGERNGVATALEDFLATQPGYECLYVPAIFGLAIVFPRSARWSEPLRNRLGCYDGNPLLARMESNRVLLYITVLELTDRLEAERRGHANDVARLEAELEATRTAAAVAEQMARQAMSDRNRALGEEKPHADPAPGPTRSVVRRFLSAARSWG